MEETLESVTQQRDQLSTEVTSLRTELATAKNDTEKLRNEAAQHRIEKSKAMRQAHALKAVLGAHKIDFNVDDADVSGLTIKDGKVEGEFDYTPKAAEGKETEPADKGVNTPLTLEDVKKMPQETINSRWDEIESLLAAQA